MDSPSSLIRHKFHWLDLDCFPISSLKPADNSRQKHNAYKDTIWFFVNERNQNPFLIKTITISVALYEIEHPLPGKPHDLGDFAATFLTGGLCFVLYKLTTI